MVSRAPVRDFPLSRVAGLISETVASGIPSDVVMAALIALITSLCFNTAVPDRLTASGLGTVKHGAKLSTQPRAPRRRQLGFTPRTIIAPQKIHG